jgi:hypothetical protein
MLSVHVDERRLVNPSRQYQLFFHAHLNYRVKPWFEVGAGGNFNWTNATVNRSLRVPEWRPWQEASLIKKIGDRSQLQFRYRLDERFIHHNDKVELLPGYHFNLRHRFRFQFSYTLNKENAKSPILRFAHEVMVNSGDVIHIFDQNRLYVAVEYPFNRHWAIETGYLNIFQSRTDDGFYDRHTMRVTLYHRFDLRKTKLE